MANDNNDQNEDGDDSGQSSSSSSDQSSGNKQEKKNPTWLVWGVRGLALLIVLSIIGYLTYCAIRPDVTPRFAYEIQHDKCGERDGRWALPVKITNEGTGSAHDLTTSVTTTGPEGRQAQQVTLPLIGPGESLTLEFWYDQDPRTMNPEASTISYLLP